MRNKLNTVNVARTIHVILFDFTHLIYSYSYSRKCSVVDCFRTQPVLLQAKTPLFCLRLPYTPSTGGWTHQADAELDQSMKTVTVEDLGFSAPGYTAPVCRPPHHNNAVDTVH